MRSLLLWMLPLVLLSALASCGPEAREDPSAAPVEGAVVEETTTTALEGCAVRFRCTFPSVVDDAAEVRAWWRERGAAYGEIRPVRRSGDQLVIEVPAGEGTVSIHVEGCVVMRREIEAEAHALTDAGTLELRRATILRGRVVDGDGAPVRRASVWPKAGELSVPLTVTAEDGRFEFDGLPAGAVRLRVESDEHVRKTVMVGHGPGGAEVTIVLDRGGEVRGVVISHDGEPDPDAYVWIVDPADEGSRDRMAWPHVEEDGTFAVHLAPGRYRIHGRANGGTGSTSVEVREGETVEARLVLAPR